MQSTEGPDGAFSETLPPLLGDQLSTASEGDLLDSRRPVDDVESQDSEIVADLPTETPDVDFWEQRQPSAVLEDDYRHVEDDSRHFEEDLE
jgi:hypothetical protein